MRDVAAPQEEAVARYVRAQLEYTKLWRALELGDKISRLLQARAGSCMPHGRAGPAVSAALVHHDATCVRPACVHA